jgi:predicted RNase H-like HicB family nuclease
MNGYKWGPTGPPLEAYSRVTDPDRFEPLHGAALKLLERLQKQFEVERVEGYGLDPDLERVDLARPSIKLTPASSAAAPIVVAFIAFPALIVRCGRWLVEAFPVCGCDACGATAEGEEQRLAELIDNVVKGRFREAIRIPLLGSAWREWEVGSTNSGAPARERIARSHARSLVGSGSRSFAWLPWPPR